MENTENYSTIACWIYISLILISFLPVLIAILKKVKLNPGGKSFEASKHFSKEKIELLEAHFSRINGTLIFWKNKAEWNRRFHIYTLF